MVGMTPKQILYAVVQEALVDTYNKEIPFVVSQWLEPHFQYMSVNTKEYQYQADTTEQSTSNNNKRKYNKNKNENEVANVEKQEVIVIYHQLFIPKPSQYKVMFGKGGIMLKHLTKTVSANISQIFGRQIIVKLDVKLKDAMSRSRNSIQM